ncbi:MAG: S9 family peptidase, partial [Bifidobacterium mongoliense]|nr:S9 family peptidase [Bifidobacterium mongoliense]
MPGEKDGRSAIPPQAKQVDHHRLTHGDDVPDPYEWMRDKQSPDLQAFVAAQNAFCERRMAPLATLRRTLFDELKSRIQETDMSVPTRMDGYWYFARTREGRQYGVQCRLPVRDADNWDPPQVDAHDEPGSMPGEEIVFDANAEAEGYGFFR